MHSLTDEDDEDFYCIREKMQSTCAFLSNPLTHFLWEKSLLFLSKDFLEKKFLQNGSQKT